MPGFQAFFELADISLTVLDFLQHAVHTFNFSRILGLLSHRAVRSPLGSLHQAVDGDNLAILSARHCINILVCDLGLVGRVGDSAGDRRSSCRFLCLDLPRRAGVLLHGNDSHRSDLVLHL